MIINGARLQAVEDGSDGTNSARLAINLGNFFSGRLSPRQALPRSQKDAVVLGSLPDPTFGGSVFGLRQSEILAGIADVLDLSPLPLWDAHASPYLTFHALDNREYMLHLSSDLTNWLGLATGFGTNGLVAFGRPSIPRRGGEFYRVEDLSAYISFTGRVVDGVTGTGVSDAVIWSSVDPASGISAADGLFSLRTATRAKRIGSYTLTVSASGYGDATIGGTVREGNHASGLVIAMYHPPRIIRQPDDITVRAGTSATLSLIAEALPSATYAWFKGPNRVGGDTPTFTIARTGLADAGEYSAVVTSAGGAIRSRVAKLVVLP